MADNEASSIATSSGDLGFSPKLSGAVVGHVGSAISDLFAASAAKQQAAGDAAEASGYRSAAALERTKAVFDEASGGLQKYQQERANYLGMSSQKAAIGSAGFANSGSAIYLAMDSANQANLAVGAIQANTGIQLYDDEKQAESYDTLATAADNASRAAKKSAKGSTIGAIAEGVAAAVMLFA